MIDDILPDTLSPAEREAETAVATTNASTDIHITANTRQQFQLEVPAGFPSLTRVTRRHA